MKFVLRWVIVRPSSKSSVFDINTNSLIRVIKTRRYQNEKVR